MTEPEMAALEKLLALLDSPAVLITCFGTRDRETLDVLRERLREAVARWREENPAGGEGEQP